MVCLAYNLQLSVRGKNKKEKISGFFKTVTQSADEVLLSNQKVSNAHDRYVNIFVTVHESVLLVWHGTFNNPMTVIQP